MAVKLGSVSTAKTVKYLTVDTCIEYYPMLYSYTGMWNGIDIDYNDKWLKIDDTEHYRPKWIQMSDTYLYFDTSSYMDVDLNVIEGEQNIRYVGKNFKILMDNTIEINDKSYYFSDVYLVSNSDVYYTRNNKLFRFNGTIQTQEKYDAHTNLYMSKINTFPIHHGIPMCKYENIEEPYIWRVNNCLVYLYTFIDDLILRIDDTTYRIDNVKYLYDKETLYLQLYHLHDDNFTTIIISNNQVNNTEYVFKDEYITVSKTDKYIIKFREYTYDADEFYINDEYLYFIKNNELYKVLRGLCEPFIDIPIDNV